MNRTIATLFVCLIPIAAHAADRPNVLFAIADDASFPHMSAYGTSWVDTPAFDRVAREGLLFNRCYTPNAKCAPSRACILTGRNSWQLEAAANHWCYFPAKFPSFMEQLAVHGYQTGYTGKGWAPGVANDEDGKKRRLTGKSYSKRRTKPPAKFISPNDYAENFDDFLDQVDGEKPFCFWYGSTEPHRRYEYQAGSKKGGKSTESIAEVPGFWPDNEVVRNDMLDYAFEIEYFDQHLGRMLESLQKRGLLENTIIVVTSDNGMPFPRVKGNCYELANHLPLAIMWPAGIRSPGREVGDYVSFIDFAPTFFDAAGINWDSSGMRPTTGRSLLPVFKQENKAPHRDFVLIGKERHDIGRPEDVGYPIRGILKDDFLLVHNYETDRWPSGNPETGYLNTDGSPTKTEVLEHRRSGEDSSFWESCFGKRSHVEFYNLAVDPNCLTNLAGESDYRTEQAELTRLMETTLTEQKDPRALGLGAQFEAFPNANPRDRGFYEKYMTDPSSVRAGWVNETDFESAPVDATPDSSR
ncbi:MAG: sulfatase [Planctomycetota bacterium]